MQHYCKFVTIILNISTTYKRYPIRLPKSFLYYLIYILNFYIIFSWVIIFTALRIVNKNQQIFFIINNFKFSRESNLEYENN